MFGSIGVTELLVIAGVALVFLGPERFPEFAKIVARTFRDVRGYMDEAKRDIAKEIKPVKDELAKLSKIDPETYIEKLADTALDGEDDDDEGSYNPEPHPEDMGFGDNQDEVALTPDEYGDDATFQYDSYTDSEPVPGEDSEEEPSELPERLDG